MKSPLLFVAFIAIASADTSESSGYSFLSIGDWGGAALTDYHNAPENVAAVAAAMATSSKSLSAKFILNTGDNFYWCGIQNTSDFQINVDFVQPYSSPYLQIPWYGTLGNHEYGYNVSAQIDYSNKNKIWVLPDRYYTKRINLSGSNYMTLIVLDTSPCVKAYRSTSSSGWDPCGSSYPTCSLTSSDDDFEGPCHFHDNIMTQNCTTQKTWFQNTLAAVPKDDWLVVMGHHPIDECDVEDLTTILQNHGFSIYLNGHTHLLNQYTLDGTGAYLTTGAGSLVSTADQKEEITMKKLRGENIEKSDRGDGSHAYQTVFSQTVAGFTSHTFDSGFTKLTTNFISYTGSVVHSFTVDKTGKIIA